MYGAINGYGDLGGHYGAYGLSKDPAKALAKCNEAKAKLRALRSKRRAKGKGDNRRVRNLEAKVARLCTWSDQINAGAGTQADADRLDSFFADFDADIGDMLAAENAAAAPTMGAGMGYQPGPGGMSPALLIGGGVLLLALLGGGAYALSR